MAGSGKILTVSYGAFSCGLDGFDDPLQTMTAILDYLRYLEAIAGDSGAAPDAPDIDILTSIAERGATGCVAVEMQAGAILLRAVPVQNDTIPAPDAGQDMVSPARPEMQGHSLRQQHPGDHACATAARVLRVRRADLEQLINHGVLQDDAGPPADGIPPDRPDTTLSAQGEIDLQRALAGIEGERAEAAGPAGIAPDRTFDRPSPDAAPADPTPPKQADAVDDLSRIFEETDSHLGASASSRRRNAIQHLRAALAATRAETRTSLQQRRDREDMPGRVGLRVAARLRRARASAQHGPSVQSADRTPDPLRLMAEHRVDTPQGMAQARPLSTADSAAMPPNRPSNPPPEDFGAFVARVEAARLPDLIEAAAAYLADIEGRMRFSRPMLMEKLDQIGVADMREDMLCACDALLTRGKLRKCSDGRYETTDKTGFRIASVSFGTGRCS